jgi:hypothetical protein
MDVRNDARLVGDGKRGNVEYAGYVSIRCKYLMVLFTNAGMYTFMQRSAARFYPW